MSRSSVSTGSSFEPLVGIARAVRIGNIITVGGTAPIGADGKNVGIGDPATQVKRCFDISLRAIEELGASIDDVIRTRLILTRIEDWEACARAHGEIFAHVRPTSTIMQVSRFIDPEWLVETELDAVVESY